MDPLYQLSNEIRTNRIYGEKKKIKIKKSIKKIVHIEKNCFLSKKSKKILLQYAQYWRRIKLNPWSNVHTKKYKKKENPPYILDVMNFFFHHFVVELNYVKMVGKDDELSNISKWNEAELTRCIAASDFILFCIPVCSILLFVMKTGWKWWYLCSSENKMYSLVDVSN